MTGVHSTSPQSPTAHSTQHTAHSTQHTTQLRVHCLPPAVSLVLRKQHCRLLLSLLHAHVDPEFGAYSDGVGDDLTDSRTLLGLADANLQSWAYWQFKGYGDPTTSAVDAQGRVFEGLYDAQTGELDVDKVRCPA
jgi:hypothetical protein